MEALLMKSFQISQMEALLMKSVRMNLMKVMSEYLRMVRVTSYFGERELNGKEKEECEVRRLCLSEMFRTREVRTNRDVLEAECSRLSMLKPSSHSGKDLRSLEIEVELSKP
ncbi:hypothetical protein A2U01_0041916, partial [Trifolium medium]|nr:hypothetical protein [Trifolium medium]